MPNVSRLILLFIFVLQQQNKHINDVWTAVVNYVNSLRDIFFRGNINIYLHFMSFLHTNKTHVVEMSSRVRQEPAYSTKSISRLLMSS